MHYDLDALRRMTAQEWPRPGDIMTAAGLKGYPGSTWTPRDRIDYGCSDPARKRVVEERGVLVRFHEFGDWTAALIVLAVELADDPPAELVAMATNLLASGYVRLEPRCP